MKVCVGSCMLVCVAGIVFMLLSILVFGEMIADNSTMMVAATSRHLRENGEGYGTDKGYDAIVSLEDYRPIDPSPSSKASVRPAPIEHGSPMIPYIPDPKPSPPSQSDPVESDGDGSDHDGSDP